MLTTRQCSRQSYSNLLLSGAFSWRSIVYLTAKPCPQVLNGLNINIPLYLWEHQSSSTQLLSMATRSILRLTVPQPCQNCRNMTVLVCDQCNTLVKLTDNRTFATYYCSQGCAAEDFPNHQAKCRRYRDHGLLYRAATVSQTLFMLTRTAAFDTLITHSEKDRDKAGRLVVHKGDVE